MDKYYVGRRLIKIACWGPKLYQDDIAEDVRDYYKDQLRRDKTNDQVTQEILDAYEEVVTEEDEAPVFWFALANSLSIINDKLTYYFSSNIICTFVY